MDLVATKIVVLTLLAAIRLVCGLLPLKITKHLQLWGEQHTGSRLLAQKRRLQIERGLSLCLCFGGGVLLATCFIHMLPEAREALDAARRASAPLLPSASSSAFPFAELFVCVGFFLVYVIEEVAHRLFTHHHAATAAAATTSTTANADSTGSGDSSVPSEVTTDAPAPVVPASAPISKEKPPSDVDAPPPPPQCCATVEAEYHKMEAIAVVADMERSQWSRPLSTSKIAPATSQVHLFASSLSLEHKDPSSDVHLHHHVHHPHLHHHHHHHPHLHPHHHHHHIPISTGDTSMLGHLRSLMVVLALSFHSVFEGLAIGLQPTTRDVWYLFTAVSIHASAILFCVGLELVMSSMRLLNMVAYITLLALVSPLGVALGVVVTSAGRGEDTGDEAMIGGMAATPGQALAVGALQAVAGGTILYITFFEVLQREKRRTDSAGPLRLVCVLAGFAVMVALQVIGGHEHSGEEGHIDVETNSTDRKTFHRHGS